MLESVARPKIRDVIVAQLRSYISEEQLLPGDKLPTETQLAAKFGVSRLSLREATKALEYLGVVEARPGRGLSVGKLNLEKVTGCLEFHPALHEASPLELIQTRVVVETGVLPYVSARMKQDERIYAELCTINDELRRTRALKQWIDLDIAFHRRLVESSGLSTLLTFADVLSAFFRRFRESVKKAEWILGIESHQRLIDALRDGKLDVARTELAEHIENHLTRINRV